MDRQLRTSKRIRRGVSPRIQFVGQSPWVLRGFMLRAVWASAASIWPRPMKGRGLVEEIASGSGDLVEDLVDVGEIGDAALNQGSDGLLDKLRCRGGRGAGKVGNFFG